MACCASRICNKGLMNQTPVAGPCLTSCEWGTAASGSSDIHFSVCKSCGAGQLQPHQRRSYLQSMQGWKASRLLRLQLLKPSQKLRMVMRMAPSSPQTLLPMSLSGQTMAVLKTHENSISSRACPCE